LKKKSKICNELKKEHLGIGSRMCGNSFVEVSFDGQGSCLAQFQELRKTNASLHNYDEFVRALERGEGIEAELKAHHLSIPMIHGSHRRLSANGTSKANAGKKIQANKHLKTLLGNNTVDNDKSKAPLIAKDSPFW
jgi:hypothetical protein